MALVQPQVIGRFPQADNRHVEFYEDHLGRVWHGPAGPKGDPESALAPYGWTAPLSPVWARGLLLPPPEYVKVRRIVGRQVKVDILIDKWIELMESRQAEYEEFQHGVAAALSGGINVPNLLDNPPPRIEKEFGPGPFPGIEFVQMVADGDLWATGRTEVIPAWAVSLLPRLRKIARAGKRLDTGSLRSYAAEDRRAKMAGLGAAPVHPPVDADPLVNGSEAPTGGPTEAAGLPVFSANVVRRMTKAELLAYARAAGVTLDETQTKRQMADAMLDASAVPA